MLCACNFNCNQTNYCTTKFNCFTKLILRDGAYSLVYGCNHDLVHTLQCNLNKLKSCCVESDLCNLNLTTSIDDQVPIRVDLIILIILACFIPLTFGFYYAWKRFKLAQDETKIKQQLKNLRQRLQVKINNPETTTGCSPGELIQRTISRDIHIDYETGPIGKGRFGIVWKAKWNDDEIAVKQFFSMNEPSWSRETQIYQAIRHENILGYITSDIMGVGCSVNMILLTEYHPLGSLYDFLTINRITKTTLFKFLSTISNGLNYLHQEIFSTSYKPSIVHRDLKTKNILVKQNFECCIADFGLAIKFDDSCITNDFELRQGSVRYMSPECLNESLSIKSVDGLKKSDVYSFSLIVWECLSRFEGCVELTEHRPPFYEFVQGDPDVELMREIVYVREIRPKVPYFLIDKELEQLIDMMKECWSNNPAERLPALYLKKKFKKILLSLA